MSRSLSDNLGPMPASIRMLASGVRTSMQFVAIKMRLRASGALSFSHMTLGTTPKTEPPSMRQWPSLNTGAQTGQASGARQRSRPFKSVIHKVDDRLQGGPEAE